MFVCSVFHLHSADGRVQAVRASRRLQTLPRKARSQPHEDADEAPLQEVHVAGCNRLTPQDHLRNRMRLRQPRRARHRTGTHQTCSRRAPAGPQKHRHQYCGPSPRTAEQQVQRQQPHQLPTNPSCLERSSWLPGKLRRRILGRAACPHTGPPSKHWPLPPPALVATRSEIPTIAFDRPSRRQVATALP